MSTVSLKDTITMVVSTSNRHASAPRCEEKFGSELLYHADEAGFSELRTSTPGGNVLMLAEDLSS